MNVLNRVAIVWNALVSIMIGGWFLLMWDFMTDFQADKSFIQQIQEPNALLVLILSMITLITGFVAIASLISLKKRSDA